MSIQNLTKNLLFKTHVLPIGILNCKSSDLNKAKENAYSEILTDLEDIFCCVFLDLYGVDGDVFNELTLDYENPVARTNKKELKEVQNITNNIVKNIKIDLKALKKTNKKSIGGHQLSRSYLTRNPSDKENRHLLEEKND